MNKKFILLLNLIISIFFSNNLNCQNNQIYSLLNKIANSSLSIGSAAINHMDKYSDYYLLPSLILFIGLGFWCIDSFQDKKFDHLDKVIKKKINNINQNHQEAYDKLVEEHEATVKFAANGFEQLTDLAIEAVAKAKGIPKKKLIELINKNKNK